MKPYKLEFVNPQLNALVYADPGVGKTLFAATAAEHEEMRDVLILNIEGGLSTLANMPHVYAVDPGYDVDPKTGNRVRNNVSILDDCENYFWKIMRKEEGFENVRTVVLDSGSELQNIDLLHIVQKQIDDGKRKGGEETKDEIYQEDYSNSTNRMRRLLRMFRDAPIHFIVTALVKNTFKKGNGKNDEPKLIEVSPQFTAKLSESAQGYVDFVWYLYTDANGDRQLLSSKRGVTKAKTRNKIFAESLGDKTENPNLAEMYQMYCDAVAPKEEKK